MNRAPEIIVLAAEGELRSALPAALAAAQVRAAPLEALAELAALNQPGPGGARKVLVAATGSLGYRAEEILRAARSIRPTPEIYLICTAAEEPQAMDMVAAGADNYFVGPDGFEDLAAAVEGRGQNKKEEHTLAPIKPGLQSVAPSGDVLKCLSRIAELSHGSSGEIAAGAVEALVEIDGVAGAGLRQGSELVTRAGSEVAAAPGRKDWPRDEWLRADGDEWIWLDAAAEEPALALVARFEAQTPGAEFLTALSTAARVLLAVYATARQREAAVKVLSTDAETGLASRTYFDRYLAALCRRAAAQQAEVALVLASPTELTPAATKGQLQALAALVQQSLGAVKVGRIEADVLAAVVTGPGAGELKSQLQALAAALARTETAAAVGAAAYPWHASDGAELLLAAETALRASRNNGDVPVVAGAIEDIVE
jgi:GGDEF domain-containing protein/predicted transcriptional regulator